MESHGIYRDMNYIVLWNVFFCFFCVNKKATKNNRRIGGLRTRMVTWEDHERIMGYDQSQLGKFWYWLGIYRARIHEVYTAAGSHLVLDMVVFRLQFFPTQV